MTTLNLHTNRRLAGSIALLALLLCLPLEAFATDPYNGIPVATGSGIDVLPTPGGPFFNIIDYGASPSANGVVNQTAINQAIASASAAGGGTVVFPAGDFKTYTIHMQSNVTLWLSDPSTVLRAARVSVDGGTYDTPEPFLWVGLQDQGHSHYANSLIYGENLNNIAVIGVKGSRIDGSYTNASGYIQNALTSSDPQEVTVRTAAGSATVANKIFGIKNCTNIITGGFDVLYGGHFCFMMTGDVNVTLLDCLIDTDYQGVDIDCCQNVTIKRVTCNSPLGDAIVYTASYGAGKFMPCKNVLTEDCTVSGYDIGSVFAGAPASTRAYGTTGGVKWGTEATCGFDTFTTRNIHFEHCSGLSIESVDGAVCKNIIVDGCTMNDIAYAPIFIRSGDRSRAPVTGTSSSESVSAPAPNVRLDDMMFVMPGGTQTMTDKYGNFPIYRWIPSYQRANQTINGQSFSVINQTAPTRLNPGSIHPDDPSYANAVGTAQPGSVSNVWIGNITAIDVDPRYGIVLAGIMDSKLQNITLDSINITYRGGLTVKNAVEQRNKTTSWSYNDWNTATSSITLQWLQSGNNEVRLPRVFWDPTLNAGAGGWSDDPFNIPEATRDYPDSPNLGILPSYGMYARHVDGLTVNNLHVGFQVPDGRPAFTLDDVRNATFAGITNDIAPGVPEFMFVTDNYKRNSNFEYLPNRPYLTTTVVNVTIPAGATVQNVTINRPSPATPPDNLYTYPTVPTTVHPYTYDVPTSSFPIPLTVHRPFFTYPVQLAPQSLTVGTPFSMTVTGRSPGGSTLSYSPGSLPAGAVFDPATQTFTWTPAAGQAGTYNIDFYLDDGVIPVKKTVAFAVSAVALTFTNSATYDIPASTVGTAITSINVAPGVSGGTTPYTFTATGLPAGITISAAGVISGTPTTVGAAGTATITVTDATLESKSITIACGAISAALPGTAPSLTIASLSGGTVDTPYSETLMASGDTPITWSIVSGSLPPGLSLNSTTGVISGTPTTDGTFNFTVTATNATGSDSKALTIVIAAAPTYAISASTLTSFGSLQTPYTQPAAQTVTVTNTGTGSVTLTQPTALNYLIGTISPATIAPGATATFTVQPKADLAVGNYDETIAIVGSAGASTTVDASFTVTAPPVDAETPTISVQPHDVTVNEGDVVTLSVQASVSDGGSLSYQWYYFGGNTGIPIGGAIISSFSPTTMIAGVYSFYVVVTNTSNSATGKKTATMTSYVATVTVKNATGIENISQATGLKAWVANGTLHVSGLTAGKQWSVYNVAGILIYQGIATGDEATQSIPTRGIYIVQSEKHTLKVVY